MSGVTSSSSETPRKKPSPFGLVSRPSATTFAPCSRPRSMYEATLSRCSRVISGPISDSGSVPGPTLTFGSRSLIAADERIGRVADGDDHRHGHAALAGRAVGRADRRVRGHVDVRVRQDDHVVLRAAERLHALPVRGAGRVDVLRDRRRADEADGGDVRVLEDRVDRDLVAVHDVEDAVGHAGLRRAARRRRATWTGPSRTASGRTCCRRRSPAPTSTWAPSPGS